MPSGRSPGPTRTHSRKTARSMSQNTSSVASGSGRPMLSPTSTWRSDARVSGVCPCEACNATMSPSDATTLAPRITSLYRSEPHHEQAAPGARNLIRQRYCAPHREDLYRLGVADTEQLVERLE